MERMEGREDLKRSQDLIGIRQHDYPGYPVCGLLEDWENGGFRVENMLRYADIWVWRTEGLWFLDFNLG